MNQEIYEAQTEKQTDFTKIHDLLKKGTILPSSVASFYPSSYFPNCDEWIQIRNQLFGVPTKNPFPEYEIIDQLANGEIPSLIPELNFDLILREMTQILKFSPNSFDVLNQFLLNNQNKLNQNQINYLIHKNPFLCQQLEIENKQKCDWERFVFEERNKFEDDRIV